MPEQPVPTNLCKALENLEDHTISTNKQKYANYEVIQKELQTECVIPVTVLKRLLAVCNHDLKEDLKFATCVVNTISIILNFFKSEECSPVPELLSTALAILDILMSTAPIRKVQALPSLCFKTFLSYPDEVYTELAVRHHAKLMEVFSLFFHQGMPVAVRFMPFDILKKILKSLPTDKRRDFTEQGISIWFSKLVPVSMTILTTSNEPTPKVMDVLELITDELEHIDYADNAQWLTILEYISQSKKYPAIMNTLLQNGNESWCQLWSIFVRLFKQQITTNKGKSCSPINSMLPIVETAFKMDTTNRCRAFQCWKVLINNFSNESNEIFINKRVKLLMVPLASNNAKVEQTIFAKFDTWWHLLRKFQSRIDTFAEIIYIPFLHFCFGNWKHAQDSKHFIPGMFSLKVKKLCLQALVEITGHTGCEGCLDQTFPKLSRKFLSPNQLKEHSADWLHIIKTVIRTCGSQDMYSEDVKQQVRCVWKSFLVVLTQVAESDRKVILNELLDWLLQLMSATKTETDTLDLVYNVLLPSCFADAPIRSLFNSKDRWNDIEAPLPKVLGMLLHPSMKRFYNDSASIAPALRALTPIMSAALDSTISSPDDMVSWLLPQLPDSDPGLVMWTALVTALKTSDVGAETVKNVMLWPLENMQMFENVQQPASVWNEAYTSLKPKLNDIETDISLLLLCNKTTNQFSLYALLQILKSVLENLNSFDCNMEAELFDKVLAKTNDVATVAPIFPVIVDSLVMMAAKVVEDQSSVLAEFTLRAAKSFMNLTLQAKKSTTNHNDYHIHIEKLLKSIDDLFIADGNFIKLKQIVAEEIIECCTVFEKFPSVKDTAISILNTFFNNCQENEEPIYSMLKDAIDSINGNNSVIGRKEGSADTKFAFPDKCEAKKTKKKQPNIVNTVVENGEEYAVIKSNWKFNPKKLTENQKEKLQKKREDIPALYQDLSQSQDELKLASWKTDSQDASSTSASSMSTSKPGNTDASTVLLKMASAEVVPKIMENILSDGNKESQKTETTNENINSNNMSLKANRITSNNMSPKPNRITALSTPKQPKSPRIALKDRVCQNVKVLIEKSTLPGEVKSPKSKELNQTSIEAAPRTPLPKSVNEVVVTYYAPPKLPEDRPSRLKRKPKKYETDFLDVELSKKKRRKSSCGLQRLEDSDENAMSQDVDEDENQTVVEAIIHEEPIKKVTPEREPVENTTKEEETAVEVPPTTKTIDPEKAKSDVIIIDNIDEDIVEETPQPKSPEAKPQITAHSKIQENSQEVDGPKIVENRNTPSPDDTAENAQKDTGKVKSLIKKKTSRIAKTLAIDMVDGHPFLNSSEYKSTRRKNFTEKLSKSLTNPESKVDPKKRNAITKSKLTEEKKSETVKELFALKETQDSNSYSTDDMPADSEDFIESSQDSTLTTISMKSTKSSTKKLPVVQVVKNLSKIRKSTSDTQSLLSSDTSTDIVCANQLTKDDIELPQNKSVAQENDQNDLTADMDTEPMVDKEVTISSSDDVIVISDDNDPIELNTDKSDVMETQNTAKAKTQVTANTNIQDMVYNDTQNTANADTQLMDPNFFASQEDLQIRFSKNERITNGTNSVVQIVKHIIKEPVTKSADNSEAGLSSPFKDEKQRNKDFLNNTLEISPIKTMSPIKDIKTATSETSSDYVVIQLSSPVQGDGEPFEKSSSPEIFTEGKVSPDKRDQSPPREETSKNTESPSLSLKKNRPQVRPSGRAAQMLDLCVEHRLKFKTYEKPAETEEPKKAMSTPAKRNLRILYNCENNEINEECEESETFLKFKKSLPTADCSPSGPILKRKLAEMADETTVSPASKRKRVSFHDPPVSTSISVHKYIEPLSLMRSPQSSSKKQGRLGRQAAIKPPKKLETAFAQTSALTELAKTVENIPDSTCSEDISSLEQTPSVEVVTTTDLDDTEPICPGLIECKDPIGNIASDLSSPAMKTLLIKELEGIVETVGDLAKMSELEVYRLCIKAPKVKVAKKVLSSYEKVLSECASKTIVVVMSETDENVILTSDEEPEAKETQTVVSSSDIEIQTDVLSSIDTEIQTDDPPATALATVETQTSDVSVTAIHTQTSFQMATTHAQTEKVAVASCKVQTDESGVKSTKDIVACLLKRPDYINEIAAQIPRQNFYKLIAKKFMSPDDKEKILRKDRSSTSKKSLVCLQEFLATTFSNNELMMLFINLMQNNHDKPV